MKEDWIKALCEPFPTDSVHWMPGKITDHGGKKTAVALAYIDARAVQDRLDAVIGPERWITTMSASGDLVTCELAIIIGDRWISKSDGAARNPNDYSGKATFSESFKRAAVMWGIGRYLYGIATPQVELINGEIPAQEKERLYAILDGKPDPGHQTRPATSVNPGPAATPTVQPKPEQSPPATPQKTESTAVPPLALDPEYSKLKQYVTLRHGVPGGATYAVVSKSIASLDSSNNNFTARITSAFQFISKGLNCTEAEYLDLFARLSKLAFSAGMGANNKKHIIERITQRSDSGEKIIDIMAEASMLFNSGGLGWTDMLSIDFLASSIADKPIVSGPLDVQSDGSF